jgi:hypothetical protein
MASEDDIFFQFPFLWLRGRNIFLVTLAMTCMEENFSDSLGDG